jgi:Flp pilus assembly protein TadG
VVVRAVTTETTRSTRLEERGAAVIEFALLVPILLLLLFGIIEFGRGYNARTTLTHASREAVRVVAVGDGDATAAARAAAPALDPAQLTVTVSASPCTPGEPVTVTVTYPFRYTVPLFGEGTITLTERGTMRCGG